MEWCLTYFEPIANACAIAAVSWEEILDAVAAVDADEGASLKAFHVQCLRFNPLVPPARRAVP